MREPGDALEVTVIHLDALFWNADWTPVGPESFAERQRAAIGGDGWVIDGNYISAPGFHERLGRADAVVIVDAPLAVCQWRVWRQRLRYRGTTRPDTGASERLTLSFVRWIWTWPRRHPDLAGEIRSLAPDTPVLVARSERDVERLLAGARAARSSTLAGRRPARPARCAPPWRRNLHRVHAAFMIPWLDTGHDAHPRDRGRSAPRGPSRPAADRRAPRRRRRGHGA